jgi:hypothetical protein
MKKIAAYKKKVLETKFFHNTNNVLLPKTSTQRMPEVFGGNKSIFYSQII